MAFINALIPRAYFASGGYQILYSNSDSRPVVQTHSRTKYPHFPHSPSPPTALSKFCSFKLAVCLAVMLNEAKTWRPRPRPELRGWGWGRGQFLEVEAKAEAKNNHEKSIPNNDEQTTYDLRLLPEKLPKLPNFTRFLPEKCPIT